MTQEPKSEDDSPTRKHALQDEPGARDPSKRSKSGPVEEPAVTPKSEDDQGSQAHEASDSASDRSDSRPSSPKDYKNLSINSILNVKGAGGSSQGSEGVGSLESPKSTLASSNTSSSYKDTDPTSSSGVSPTPPKLLNTTAAVTTTTSTTTTTAAPSSQTTNPEPSPEEPAPATAYPAPLPVPPQPVVAKSGEVVHSFHPGGPMGYPGAGAPLYGGPGQPQPGVAAGQPMLGSGAQLHHLNFHQMSHQQHQGSPDMDLLHESKRGRRFRRRYNQIVRRYSCSYPGCSKSYGSLNHLNTHIVTKKHGHRKSKADFQHSQFPSGDHEPPMPASALYADHAAYSPQPPPVMHSEYPANYWYNYRAQGVSQPPSVAGQGQVLPHSHSVPSAVPPGPGLPPPPPPHMPGMGFYYYPPGYQHPPPAPPPPAQHPAGVNWPPQPPQYPVYAHAPAPYHLAPGSSLPHPPPPPPSAQLPGAPSDRPREGSEKSHSAAK